MGSKVLKHHCESSNQLQPYTATFGASVQDNTCGRKWCFPCRIIALRPLSRTSTEHRSLGNAQRCLISNSLQYINESALQRSIISDDQGSQKRTSILHDLPLPSLRKGHRVSRTAHHPRFCASAILFDYSQSRYLGLILQCIDALVVLLALLSHGRDSDLPTRTNSTCYVSNLWRFKQWRAASTMPELRIP